MSDAVDPHLEGPQGREPGPARPNSSAATAATARRCSTRAFKCPGLRRGPRHRLRLRARHGADRRARRSPSARCNIWRFEELLPIASRHAQARVGQFAGQTPLIHADRLGAELGLKNLYLKDDSTNRPTLSYKDRVVGDGDRPPARARQGRGRLRLDRQRRHRRRGARRRGRRQAYVFYPGNMEKGKAKACRALGAQVCQLDGNYDQANRACRELSLASGIQFANITLRPFYAEGAKTMAFEVVEQLDWDAPDHIVIPAAGGTLSSRVHKGLNELETVGLAETAATKINIAQAGGCSPIATAIRRWRRDRPADARDRRALAGDRRAGRRQPGDRRGPQRAAARRRPPPTPRSSRRSTCSAAPRASSPSRPAAPRSPPRRSSPRKGRSAPTRTVVAVISGNGLKTLSEHPDKPWPEMVPCNVETMGEMLAEFRDSRGDAR